MLTDLPYMVKNSHPVSLYPVFVKTSLFDVEGSLEGQMEIKCVFN